MTAKRSRNSSGPRISLRAVGAAAAPLKFGQLLQLVVAEGAGLLELGRLVGAVQLAQTTLVHVSTVCTGSGCQSGAEPRAVVSLCRERSAETCWATDSATSSQNTLHTRHWST